MPQLNPRLLQLPPAVTDPGSVLSGTCFCFWLWMRQITGTRIHNLYSPHYHLLCSTENKNNALIAQDDMIFRFGMSLISLTSIWHHLIKREIPENFNPVVRGHRVLCRRKNDQIWYKTDWISCRLTLTEWGPETPFQLHFFFSTKLFQTLLFFQQTFCGLEQQSYVLEYSKVFLLGVDHGIDPVDLTESQPFFLSTS